MKLNQINPELKVELQKEYLRSEKRRVLIILTLVTISFLIVPIIHILSPELIDNAMNRKEGRQALLLSFAVFMLFEILFYLHINYLKKKKIHAPTFIRFINTTVEFSLTSLMLFYAVKYDYSLLLLEYDGFGFLIILIILSALHHDLRVSIMAGILAAIGYSLVAFWAFSYLEISENLPQLKEIYGARSMGLVVFGLLSGLVARESDKKLIRAITFQYERKQVELLLGQQVSKEIADELMTNKDPGSSQLATAAIMFLDIRNFSSWADSKSPEEVIDYQNKIFCPIIEIISKHNGIINQFLGDGFMASFGVPKKDPEFIQNAFNAGLEIKKKIKEMELAEEIPPTFIRIGLHTGKIIFGNIGNTIRRQFSLAGRNIIIASRLEQLNKEVDSHYLISNKVKEKIEPNGHQINDLGLIRLKGIDEEINVFQVEC